MITITAESFDINSPLVINRAAPASDLNSLQRRVSRTKTLDGGTAIYDGGFAEGDRTLTVEERPTTKAQVDQAKTMLKQFNWFRVSTIEGLFRCKLVSFSTTDDRMVLQFFVESKVV